MRILDNKRNVTNVYIYILNGHAYIQYNYILIIFIQDLRVILIILLFTIHYV